MKEPLLWGISLPSDEVYRVGDGGPDHAVDPQFLYGIFYSLHKLLVKQKKITSVTFYVKYPKFATFSEKVAKIQK